MEDEIRQRRVLVQEAGGAPATGSSRHGVKPSASGKACRHTRGLMYATECRLAGHSLREHEGRPGLEHAPSPARP